MAKLVKPASLPKPPPPPALVDSHYKRDEMAKKLSSFVIEALDSYSGLATSVWKQVNEYLRDTPASADVAPAEDMPALHTPFIRQRVYNAAGQIVSICVKPDPMMLAESGLSDFDSDSMQKIGQTAWEQGGFVAACSRNAISAVSKNKAIWHQSFEAVLNDFEDVGAAQASTTFEGKYKYIGVRWEAIPITDFVIGPPTTCEDAAFVGHRFYQLGSTINEKMRLGLYFKGDLEAPVSLLDGEELADEDFEVTNLTPSNPNQQTQGVIGANLTSPDVFMGFPETETIECFEIIISLAEPGALRRRWKAVIALRNQRLLSFDRWHWTQTFYYDSQVEVDDTAFGFWPEISPGRSAIPLQDQYDRFWSLAYSGIKTSAMKPMAGVEVRGEKTTYADAFQILDVDASAGEKPWVPDLEYEGEAVAGILQKLENVGDQIFRTTVNALGANTDRATTATQSQFAAQGANLGINDFLLNFTRPFPKMMAGTMELLSDPRHWELFAPMWGFTDVDPLLLKMPCRWEVAGRSLEDSPQIQFGKMGQIMQLANDPRSRIDVYKLTGLMVKALMLSGSPSIQLERVPEQAQQDMAGIEQNAAMANQPQPPEGGAPPAPQGPPGPTNGHASGPRKPMKPAKIAMTPQDAGGGGSLPALPTTVVRPGPHPPNGSGPGMAQP